VPGFDEKQKYVPAEMGLAEAISRRWSPRAFADRRIAKEDLRRLFEAARWAPSSYNEQPWRFLVGMKGDPTYQGIFDSLTEFNQGWAKSASVLILTVARTEFSSNGKPNHHGLHDLGLATAMLMVQATHLGLHTHGMAGFDHAKARATFGIPPGYEMGAVIAVGYFGNPEDLAGGMKEREMAPRQRRPLEEIVLADWAKPAEL
jgi:nitroreductase